MDVNSQLLGNSSLTQKPTSPPVTAPFRTIPRDSGDKNEGRGSRKPSSGVQNKFETTAGDWETQEWYQSSFKRSKYPKLRD